MRNGCPRGSEVDPRSRRSGPQTGAMDLPATVDDKTHLLAAAYTVRTRPSPAGGMKIDPRSRGSRPQRSAVNIVSIHFDDGVAHLLTITNPKCLRRSRGRAQINPR